MDNKNKNDFNLFDESVLDGQEEKQGGGLFEDDYKRPVKKAPQNSEERYVYRSGGSGGERRSAARSGKPGNTGRPRQGISPESYRRTDSRKQKGGGGKGNSPNKKRANIIFAGIMSVCAVVLVFSIIRIVGIVSTYKGADKEYDDLFDNYVSRVEVSPPAGNAEEGDDESTAEDTPQEGLSINFDQLKKTNSDFAGWIDMPGTVVSYPTVRSSDNEYYLDHTFVKSKNASGAIFMDYNNNSDYSSFHTILYGHNVKTGSMFGGLHKYSDASYLAKNPYMFIYMPDKTYKYKIISAKQTDWNDPTYRTSFQDQADFENFRSEIGYGGSSKLLTLSTCVSGSDKSARYIVTGELVETLAPISNAG